MNRTGILTIVGLFTMLFMQVHALPVLAETFSEDQSSADTLYVRGLISRVYPDEMQISVQPPKGKLIRITIDPDTILDGVSQFGEFEKEQQVKVWYALEPGHNRALKIIKMMELGC